jgi:hypothetical protein
VHFASVGGMTPGPAGESQKKKKESQKKKNQ